MNRDVRRKAFWVVDDFEEELASYCGAPYAVAVDSCTNALFLSLVLEARRMGGPQELTLPARTYAGVAQAALNAGWSIRWDRGEWSEQYTIPPTRVVDAALNLSPGSYEPGTLTCLSFHAAKQLPVGIGGAVLLDDENDRHWLRGARMDGRQEGTNEVSPQKPGYHCFMPPDVAARGLWLLTALKGEPSHPCKRDAYPDLAVLIG
ncbi:MAG: DegT/DnrJ/EryC1/StrS family aminotransferase [Bacteroidales bacterium]|nr:DegT/DnrJ/EryC1/StrS family aminotransferase [Bacteroidales bacterium]